MQSNSPVICGSAVENAVSASASSKGIPSTSKVNAASKSKYSNTEVAKSSIFANSLSEIDREVMRLIGQHLCDIGMTKSSESLMLESGCCLEHTAATRFRSHIMQGMWSKAEATLPEIKPLLKQPRARHLQRIRFFLMEQKFLELLEDGKVVEALSCLRNQITPINIFTNRVHQLSSFLMISDPQELQKAANWDGKGMKSRAKLLKKLQGYLPVSVMMRPNRLISLLNQALLYQQSKCIFHNSSTLQDISSYSLLSDHKCLGKNFPSATQQTLKKHSDDVLFCQFSHDGKMLATGSKDLRVIIWDVDPVTHLVVHAHTMTGHSTGVGYLSWSPDDCHLISCGIEDSSELFLWNTTTGTLESTLKNSPEDSISCCCWMPDGTKYIAGGNKGQFMICDLRGLVLDSWEGVRVQCVGCLPDNTTVLAADAQQRVRAYDFAELSDDSVIKEDHPIMSFSLSEDGRLIILNVATQGVHLWDVEDKILVRKFHGLVHGFYMIYSSFGGCSDEYIASGSEDHKVYIWHRSREKPIETLTGHSKTVNCVSWNKAIPSMLASASDDGTIRIWGPLDNVVSDSDEEHFQCDDH